MFNPGYDGRGEACDSESEVERSGGEMSHVISSGGTRGSNYDYHQKRHGPMSTILLKTSLQVLVSVLKRSSSPRWC